MIFGMISQDLLVIADGADFRVMQTFSLNLAQAIETPPAFD